MDSNLMDLMIRAKTPSWQRRGQKFSEAFTKSFNTALSAKWEADQSMKKLEAAAKLETGQFKEKETYKARLGSVGKGELYAPTPAEPGASMTIAPGASVTGEWDIKEGKPAGERLLTYADVESGKKIPGEYVKQKTEADRQPLMVTVTPEQSDLIKKQSGADVKPGTALTQGAVTNLTKPPTIKLTKQAAVKNNRYAELIKEEGILTNKLYSKKTNTSFTATEIGDFLGSENPRTRAYGKNLDNLFQERKQVIAERKALRLPNLQKEEISKEGGVEKIDAQGNRAIVYPDGTFKEIK